MDYALGILLYNLRSMISSERDRNQESLTPSKDQK